MTSEAITRPVGFWLVPAPAEHARLSRIIDELARALDAPPFEPHVTLHVGEQTAEDDVGALLTRVAASLAPIALAARSTAHTPALFKTLFIEFEPDDRPRALYRSLRDGLARRADYTLQPHLSLLYKELPEAMRAELAARHDFRGERLVFDHIAAVRPGGHDDHWMDIRAWDVWQRASLGG